MQAFDRIMVFTISFVLIIVMAFSAMADIPAVSGVMITDVTTTSFSVVWASSEASTADLDVFYDVDGTEPVADVAITAHPVNDPAKASDIAEVAENNGVMKVVVTGLQPDTSYYFQTITTSKSTLDTAYEPESSPFTDVVTEIETIRTLQNEDSTLPFSNDIIIEPCYLEDGSTAAEGTLLIATVAGANYPISAFVGDGIENPYALIDLNNLYSRDDFKNLDLEQEENITLLNYRGMLGASVVTYNVPEDEALNEIKPADFSLKSGWNMISFQLDPNDTDVLAVLSPIMDNIDSIWAYNTSGNYWYRYDENNPFPWLNDLSEMQSNVGYWVVMNQEGSLKVNGSFPTESIALKAGWNLVGGNDMETVPVGEAFESISEYLVAVWYYNTESESWLQYDNTNPYSELNDLQNIEPGKGYWVVVDQDCTW